MIYEQLPRSITVKLEPGEQRTPRLVMSSIYLVFTRYPSTLLSTCKLVREKARPVFDKFVRANPIQIIQSLPSRYDPAFALKCIVFVFKTIVNLSEPPLGNTELSYEQHYKYSPTPQRLWLLICLYLSRITTHLVCRYTRMQPTKK